MAALGRLGTVARVRAIPSASRPTARRHKSHKPLAPPPTNTVQAELRRIGELRRRAGAENSRVAKAALIAEYSDLRDLLELVYDPSTRFGVKSGTVKEFLGGQWDGDAPASLSELFRSMAAREAGDPSARGAVANFCAAHGIVANGRVDEALWDEFARLLDRNLKAGFNQAFLSKVPWKEDGRKKKRAVTPTIVPATDDGIPRFSCALGKPIHPPFDEVFSPGARAAKVHTRWFASRKLDGVRCLALVDVRVSTRRAEVLDVRFVSRSGNEFTSLGLLREQLMVLGDVPGFRKLVNRDTALRTESGGEVKRLVLDGEVALMRDKTPEEAQSSGGDWATPAMPGDGVEDFNETVSWVRRLRDQVPDPRFFLFDVLTWSEVASGQGERVFSKRTAEAEALAVGLAEVLKTKGVDTPFVRALRQREVTARAEVEDFVERATREGWEGIILRADRGYKGKRIADIYKCKRWQDAEYTVESVDTSRQRLSVDGVYGEHDACANVWITHEGVRVSVGTGFTTEQRLRYGRHPEDIIGKQITVEFFTESSGGGRGKEEKSLRFPRVKAVWEEGKRRI
ncbi:uncharacterized protein LOC62_02G003325 [Vanrija pseudolonga]|uniref:ATP-dependent DNA ligase family profile domain-containing protein n=1 Tax=Vanrija pseudolonga TaxID=143232 RepID=A0AAF0Y887_9TREE|nr:hypothetical protein LOC62_02G003325 [Vanrija pseudolonga]